jgi:hypothetical protein
MEMARKWYIRVRQDRMGLDVDGVVSGESPHDAFLRFVRRKKVWPQNAGAYMEHHPGGSTYWIYPTRRVRGGGTALGDRYVARIEEVQE